MTRTLILMRHAKSSWDDPLLADKDRSLNPRGQRSARALGDWMRDRGWLPDQVLCSTATRTRETLAGLGIAGQTDFRDALYHADPKTMLRVLGEASGRTVLMLGHNPGIGELAGALVRSAPDHPRFADYPTGSTLVVQFASPNWDEVTPGTGEAVDFIVPRDLPGV